MFLDIYLAGAKFTNLKCNDNKRFLFNVRPLLVLHCSILRFILTEGRLLHILVMYGCTIQPQSSYDHGTLFTVNDRCYEAVPARHAWRVAENNCVAKGGHLAHVYNARQNEAISEVVRTHIGQSAWLGLNELNQDYLKWVSGTNRCPKQNECLYDSTELLKTKYNASSVIYIL